MVLDTTQAALYMNNFNEKEIIKMEELKKMLEEKFPNVDFDAEKALVSGGVLDSLQVVEIIGEIEDMFDISVTMEYIQPDYFESVETMWDMIEELQ